MKGVHNVYYHLIILSYRLEIPMQYVEAPGQSQEEHVVSSDVLDVPQLVYHVKLGQNSQPLQSNTKRP